MWIDRIRVEKKYGIKWVAEFVWSEGDPWTFYNDEISDFICYGKTKAEAQEKAEQWLIEQAEKLLWDLGAWTDTNLAPCPHCNKMTQWNRMCINNYSADTLYKILPRDFPPHYISDITIKSFRDALYVFYWECQNCKGIVQ